MGTGRDPREVVQELLENSECRVQHGAVIVRHGEIIGRGHNYCIGEMGMHAEFAAINDALNSLGENVKKLRGTRIVTAGRWKKSKNLVDGLPCQVLNSRSQNASTMPCMAWIKNVGINEIEYRAKNGKWFTKKV